MACPCVSIVAKNRYGEKIINIHMGTNEERKYLYKSSLELANNKRERYVFVYETQ